MATAKNREEFKAGIAKALLSTTPATAEFAQRFGLSPDEMCTVINEALLHLEGGFKCDEQSGLPITAMPPAELMRLSSNELRTLLDNFPRFSEQKLS